jgi:hypothetical protein
MFHETLKDGPQKAYTFLEIQNMYKISLFLIEMAAVTDVVLQCGVSRQEYFLLNDYCKHQCADNNST